MSLRSFRSAGFSCFVVTFAAACGGSVFSQTDNASDGGSANTGGSSSKSGSASTGGSSSKSGSASTGGKPSKGGSGAVGGSVGNAGSSTNAGSASVGGGGVNCAAVDCAFPVCADGQMPLTVAGSCCPSCPPPQLGCGNVMCEPVTGCTAGYKLTQPAGACCQGCVPDPGMVACPEVACPKSLCPLGYVRGDLVGGCCTDCVPDALFCNEDSECVVADRPRSCCGCPEIINVRAYDADPCWSSVNEPRPIPKSCYPQVVCDAFCGQCAPPPSAVCRNHRCWESGLK